MIPLGLHAEHFKEITGGIVHNSVPVKRQGTQLKIVNPVEMYTPSVRNEQYPVIYSWVWIWGNIDPVI